LTIECDVLVVGAGPAGSVAALSALNNGIESVLIVERSNNIGGLTSQKIDFVENHGLDSIINELKLPINHVSYMSRWYSPSNKCFSFESKIADYWIKRGPSKDSFESSTIASAIKRGAELLLNNKVTGCNKDVTIKKGDKTEKINAKVVIDASGIHSKVRYSLDKNSPKGTVEEIIGYGVIGNDFNMEEGVPEIFFDNEHAPGSYVLACKDPNDGVGYLVQGIGKNRNVNPAKYFQNLIEKNKRLKDIINGAEIIKTVQGTLYVETSVPTKFRIGKVMFVGDSAHLMDPFLHYGVRPAIISGYISGNIAADYLSTNDEKHLQNYETQIRNAFNSELKRRLKYRKIFDKLNNNDMENIFDLLIGLNEKDVDFDSFFEHPYNHLPRIVRETIKHLSCMSLIPKIVFR
jgi:digeranylgeranylglycerophospholipid reductase